MYNAIYVVIYLVAMLLCGICNDSLSFLLLLDIRCHYLEESCINGGLFHDSFMLLFVVVVVWQWCLICEPQTVSKQHLLNTHSCTCIPLNTCTNCYFRIAYNSAISVGIYMHVFKHKVYLCLCVLMYKTDLL